MKRWFGLLAFLVLLSPAAGRAAVLPSCGAPAAAAALTAPIAHVFINGVCTDLSGEIVRPEGSKVWHLDATIGAHQISAVFNPDPSITFGVTTKNLSPAPATYVVLFATPITPAFYINASSTGGVSLTSGPRGAVVDPSLVYPTYISGYGTVGSVPTNLGVDLGTLPCSVVGSFATTTCSQGSTSNSFAPTFYDNLEALLTYDQTGNSSVASWSVGVSITPVPLPAAAWLFGSALAGLGALRTARRRRAERAA